MRLMRPILLACAGSLLITFMISWLAYRAGVSPHDTKILSVSAEASPVLMTSSNLVDVLAQLPLRMHISRAVWSGSTLTLDLNVGTTPEAVEAVYSHMRQLILFSFTQTTNVKQLFLRFVTPDDGTNTMKRLLLAADARRDDLDAADLNALQHMQMMPSPELEDKLHLRYTALWNKKFGSTD